MPSPMGWCIKENGEDGGKVWERPLIRVFEASSEKQGGNIGWKHPRPLWSLRKITKAIRIPRANASRWQSCASQRWSCLGFLPAWGQPVGQCAAPRALRQSCSCWLRTRVRGPQSNPTYFLTQAHGSASLHGYFLGYKTPTSGKQ